MKAEEIVQHEQRSRGHIVLGVMHPYKEVPVAAIWDVANRSKVSINYHVVEGNIDELEFNEGLVNFLKNVIFQFISDFNIDLFHKYYCYEGSALMRAVLESGIPVSPLQLVDKKNECTFERVEFTAVKDVHKLLQGTKLELHVNTLVTSAVTMGGEWGRPLVEKQEGSITINLRAVAESRQDQIVFPEGKNQHREWSSRFASEEVQCDQYSHSIQNDKLGFAFIPYQDNWCHGQSFDSPECMPIAFCQHAANDPSTQKYLPLGIHLGNAPKVINISIEGRETGATSIATLILSLERAYGTSAIQIITVLENTQLHTTTFTSHCINKRVKNKTDWSIVLKDFQEILKIIKKNRGNHATHPFIVVITDCREFESFANKNELCEFVLFQYLFDAETANGIETENVITVTEQKYCGKLIQLKEDARQQREAEHTIEEDGQRVFQKEFSCLMAFKNFVDRENQRQLGIFPSYFGNKTVFYGNKQHLVNYIDSLVTNFTNQEELAVLYCHPYKANNLANCPSLLSGIALNKMVFNISNGSLMRDEKPKNLIVVFDLRLNVALEGARDFALGKIQEHRDSNVLENSFNKLLVMLKEFELEFANVIFYGSAPYRWFHEKGEFDKSLDFAMSISDQIVMNSKLWPFYEGVKLNGLKIPKIEAKNINYILENNNSFRVKDEGVYCVNSNNLLGEFLDYDKDIFYSVSRLPIQDGKLFQYLYLKDRKDKTAPGTSNGK